MIVTTESQALAEIERGDKFCRERNLTSAEICFRTAINLQPDWPMPYNNLGWILQTKGLNTEALENYERALSLDPNCDLARLNLASLLIELGRFDRAEPLWTILLRCYPDDLHLLDQLISLSLRAHNLAAASQYAYRYAAIARGSPWCNLTNNDLTVPLVLDPLPKLTTGKLDHDIQQIRFLQTRHTHPIFDEAIHAIDQIGADVSTLPPIMPDEIADNPYVKHIYGRIIYHSPAPRIADGAISRLLFDPAVEQHYIDSRLGLVVIDDFLQPAALSGLQKFCLESTIWHTNRYSFDRLGAFFREGFNCPLLVQIAEELPRAFNRIIGDRHPLLQMWGFKYGRTQPITSPHADFAAINVNFWITPDAANLDKRSGGLFIYDVRAPNDWNFDAYNRQGARITRFLKASGAQAIYIPYRCNRAVVFNSNLFHSTAPFKFDYGYENRRINVTMLYGRREEY